MMAPGLQISRNMTIVRQGNELTLISAVRLNEQGLAALEKLGQVKHVVKLGAYHLGNITMIDIGKGTHFVQEDNPHKIGSELAKWYQSI